MKPLQKTQVTEANKLNIGQTHHDRYSYAIIHPESQLLFLQISVFYTIHVRTDERLQLPVVASASFNKTEVTNIADSKKALY